jgi:hypothetical protein
MWFCSKKKNNITIKQLGVQSIENNCEAYLMHITEAHIMYNISAVVGHYYIYLKVSRNPTSNPQMEII